MTTRRLERAVRNARRYFAVFRDPRGGEHPIDAAVGAAPDLVRMRKRLSRASAQLGQEVGHSAAFIAQQDMELEYRSVREEVFFGVGYQLGLAARHRRRKR
jgi:hypothetical protein